MKIRKGAGLISMGEIKKEELMLGTLFNNRYLLTAELGRGGMSVVYRGHDSMLDRDVAVKVLSSSALGVESKNRLMHEARASARLNHPHIIQVFDAGESGSQPFIVMQLLEGESLYQHKPASLVETLTIAQHICMALAHAHAHGVIHRDLKPENVIITPDGQAVLTDFGLARSVVSRISSEGSIMGTVSYLSPEQAMGQDIDGRTDLYALGVLLYEMICQRLPFVAEDPVALIAQHLYAPVVPPSTYCPDIPPALDALIVQLLNKRPEDRPSSAMEVLAALQSLAIPPTPISLSSKTDEGQERNLSPLDRLARGRLVGRERELTETKRLWKRASLGESQVLLISGESGVGKTPLVHALIALAKFSGGRALVGRCFREGSAPYEPIAQIIHAALEEPLTLPNLVLEDLLTLAPDLRDRFPATSADAETGLLGEQQRLFESVFTLVSTLAARAPVLLVVEDAQWADRGTISLLRHLARRARFTGARLLTVLTYRENKLSEATELNRLLHDLNRERLTHRIKLSRFNRQQTAELLSVMFQEQVSDEFLDAVYTETEGNLYFVEELCKTLIEEGKITLENGHWQWTGPKEIELPQNVRVTIQARISRLPEPVQELLQLASIFGRDFDFDTLKRAAEIDEEEIINALEIAERAQLIAEVRPQQTARGSAAQGGRGSHPPAGRVVFAFEHNLIPITLREGLTSLRGRRLHRKAAEAIQAIHPGDFATLAYHHDQAGDQENARQFYKRAGDQALSVYANQDAIHFYTEALSLYDPDDPAQFDILSARATAYDLTAQRQAQLDDARLMLALTKEINDEPQRRDAMQCEALLVMAAVYRHTDPTLARDPAGRALEIARSLADPVREGRALRQLGEEAYLRSNYPESRSLLEEAARRFQDAGLPAKAAACLNMLSLVLGYQGIGDIAASQKAVEEALSLSRQAGDRRQEGTSLRRLAIVYTDQFRHAEALPFAQAALDLHQETGDRGETERALNVIGLIMGWLGRDSEAEDYLRRSLEIAESADSVEGIANAGINLCWIFYAKRGEYEASLHFLNALIDRVRRMRNAQLNNTLLGRKAEILVTIGQFEQARTILQDIWVNAQDVFSVAYKANIQAAIGLMSAEIGDRLQSRQYLASALDLARQVDRPLESAVALYIYATAELLQGTQESLLEGMARAKEALALLSGTNWKFDLGNVLRLVAELHLALDEVEPALARSDEMMRLVTGFPLPMERFEFVHSRALRAAGRIEEADQHLRIAYERVMHVAQNFRDQELLHGWLHNVRINRMILEAAS